MRFIAGNYRGKNRLAIQTDNYDSRIDDPHNNHAYFKFNTDYSYFKYEGQGTFTFSFGARYRRQVSVSNKKNTSTYFVPKIVTSIQSKPFAAGTGRNTAYFVYDSSSGDPVSSSFIPQRNGSAVRVLSVYGSGGNFYVREQALLHDSNLSGISFTLTVYAFSIVNTAGSDPTKMLRVDSDKVTFGGGKFDSSLPYLHQTNSNFSGVFVDGGVVNNDHFSEFGRDINGDTVEVTRVGFSYKLAGTAESYGGVDYVTAPTLYKVEAE